MHRVKVYKLNESGAWDDKGTGMVTVGTMEVMQAPSASLRSLENGCRPAAAALKGCSWTPANLGINVSQTAHHSSVAMGLVVISEQNQRTLMAHRISSEDIYHRQGTLSSASATV